MILDLRGVGKTVLLNQIREHEPGLTAVLQARVPVPRSEGTPSY